MTDLPDSTRWQLWIVVSGFLIQSLNTTTVNTTLPSMVQGLGESPLYIYMVIVSYVLTVAVMPPVSGQLADKVGVRNVLFIAIVLFTLGSLFYASSDTLSELLPAYTLRGVGGAMMVPVGRLTVMKIISHEQYMAAITFVTLPGQVGPLLGPVLGGLLVEYASWHWIFLINTPVGIIGAIVTPALIPNYAIQAQRFDLSGFLLLAVGMTVLTLVLDGSKGTSLSPLAITGPVTVGVVALALCLLHARNDSRALFNLKLFRTRTLPLNLTGSFAGRVDSGMLPFMTPVFLQTGLGFSPFYAGLMTTPMVLGSMGMKRIVVQVMNHFSYRRVPITTIPGLLLVTLLFMTTALLGWYYVLLLVLFLQGTVNSTRLSSMNTLTLKDLPNNLVNSGSSLLSVTVQLSMSIGVTIAELLLRLFGSQYVSVDNGTTQAVSMYIWLSMTLIIALPAFIFARVPDNTHQNVVISRRERSAQ